MEGASPCCTPSPASAEPRRVPGRSPRPSTDWHIDRTGAAVVRMCGRWAAEPTSRGQRSGVTAMRVTEASRVGCDGARPSPSPTTRPQCATPLSSTRSGGWGAIPGPADAAFDPEGLAPLFLSPRHQLLPADNRGGCSPATRLPQRWEQRSLHSKEPHALSCGQLAARTAVATSTWINPRQQGLQLV